MSERGRGGRRASGGGALLLVALLALVAAFGAGRASAAQTPAPWEAYDALDSALVHTNLTSLRLHRANHVLKDIGDQQSTGADYIADLPFSDEFTRGFEAWLAKL